MWQQLETTITDFLASPFGTPIAIFLVLGVFLVLFPNFIPWFLHRIGLVKYNATGGKRGQVNRRSQQLLVSERDLQNAARLTIEEHHAAEVEAEHNLETAADNVKRIQANIKAAEELVAADVNDWKSRMELERLQRELTDAQGLVKVAILAFSKVAMLHQHALQEAPTPTRTLSARIAASSALSAAAMAQTQELLADTQQRFQRDLTAVRASGAGAGSDNRSLVDAGTRRLASIIQTDYGKQGLLPAPEESGK